MHIGRARFPNITDYCGISSLTKSDTVRRALCSCVKIDSQLLKQSKNVESDIDILGNTSSQVGSSSAQKGMVRNKPTSWREFHISTLEQGRTYPVVLCCVGKSSQATISVEEICG